MLPFGYIPCAGLALSPFVYLDKLINRGLRPTRRVGNEFLFAKERVI